MITGISHCGASRLRGLLALTLLLAPWPLQAGEPLTDLVSPDPGVRDRAAEMLRRDHVEIPRSKWEPFLADLHVGMDMGDAMSLFPDGVLNEDSPSLHERITRDFRLDPQWVLRVTLPPFRPSFGSLTAGGIASWSLERKGAVAITRPPAGYSGVWRNYYYTTGILASQAVWEDGVEVQRSGYAWDGALAEMVHAEPPQGRRRKDAGSEAAGNDPAVTSQETVRYDSAGRMVSRLVRRGWLQTETRYDAEGATAGVRVPGVDLRGPHLLEKELELQRPLLADQEKRLKAAQEQVARIRAAADESGEASGDLTIAAQRSAARLALVQELTDEQAQSTHALEDDLRETARNRKFQEELVAKLREIPEMLTALKQQELEEKPADGEGKELERRKNYVSSCSTIFASCLRLDFCGSEGAQDRLQALAAALEAISELAKTTPPGLNQGLSGRDFIAGLSYMTAARAEGAAAEILRLGALAASASEGEEAPARTADELGLRLEDIESLRSRLVKLISVSWKPEGDQTVEEQLDLFTPEGETREELRKMWTTTTGK